MNREQWLTDAAQLLRPMVEQATESQLPSTLQMSTGFPSKLALSVKRRRFGECWPPRADTVMVHVFISPLLMETATVTGVLLHELVHAALPAKVKHGGKFASACKRLGFEGKPTRNAPGPDLAARLNEVLAPLSAYPHVAITPVLRDKKQSTRLRLYECSCPVKVRVASDDFDATCNLCDSAFVLMAKRDD